MSDIQPTYKIEVWDPTPTKLHTIENENITLRFKSCLTSNVGTFSFNLPISLDGFEFLYNDIDSYDQVKIWVGWGSLPANPLFVGKIYHIHTPVSVQGGYLRVFKGRDYGEILQRRLKGMKEWDTVDASVIVNELADDLIADDSLAGKDIETDTTDVTMTINVDRHETYFNLMKALSDYGTGLIKKDFYVSWENKLVWKSRPLRTSGVETFALEDFMSYSTLENVQAVKNKIYVYGAKEKAYGDDKDFGTDMSTPHKGSTVDQASAQGQKNLYVASTTSFSADDPIYVWYNDRVEENEVDWVDAGVKLVCKNNLSNDYPVASFVIVYPGWGPTSSSTTVTSDAANKEVGSRSIKITGSTSGWCGALYKPSSMANLNLFPTENFYLRADSAVSGYVRYQDTSGKFGYKVFPRVENDSEFHFQTLYHGKYNQDGWVLDSGFDWTSLYTVEVGMYDGSMNFWVDGQFFNHRCFSASAEDSTSQTAYGLREMMHIDEALHSDAECLKRAETLLYQKKEVPIRLDFQVNGNSNVLIGDRLTLTLDPNNLSSVDFDVLTVEHILSGKPIGWRTNVTALNTANLRTPAATSPREYLVNHIIDNLEVAKGRVVIK